MITITAPVTDSLAGAMTMSDFFTCGGVATGLLIFALIVKELLESESEGNYKKTAESLRIVILPLTLVFCIIVIYKFFLAFGF